MSVLNELRLADINPRTDEWEVVHVWRHSRHALCGTIATPHPECWNIERWPATGGWPLAYVGDKACPTCGRPLCAFCEFLMRQGS